MEQDLSADLFDLRLDPQTSSYLSESARWGRFLSIVGFVFSGLIVLVALFAGSFLAGVFRNLTGEGSILGGFVTFIYIVYALLLFFPSLFLYNYSTKMLLALKNKDQEVLAVSFRNLRSCLRFYGIVAIVMLGLFGFLLILGVIGAAFR